MKKSTLIQTLGLVTLIGITGCKHKGVGVTEIPGMNRPAATGPGIDGGEKLPTPHELTSTPTGIGFPTDASNPYAATWNNPHDEDRQKFAADTVHFDTDSASIKAGDRSKLDEVANYFKNNTSKEALQIEGNCDERGTEQYNLSLGDKRALAVREYLANLGVDPQRIKTVSYGEAKPVDTERNEAAYAKNRRAEMVLLVPKQ
jgi:peptidoglycan-associated lipoprotein